MQAKKAEARTKTRAGYWSTKGVYCIGIGRRDAAIDCPAKTVWSGRGNAERSKEKQSRVGEGQVSLRVFVPRKVPWRIDVEGARRFLPSFLDFGLRLVFWRGLAWHRAGRLLQRRRRPVLVLAVGSNR